jgi:uncharacterized protein
MPAPKAHTLEEYLSVQEPAKAKTLRSIINFILTEFPALECKIAWNVPQIHLQGKYVFGLAAFQRHLTLAPWSPRIIAAFKPRLRPFVVKQHCFQITVDWTVDQKLLKDLVQARLTELDQSISP